MLLVTGFNDSADGIAFLAETDDPAEAFRMLLAQWNSTGDDQMKLVVGHEGKSAEYERTQLVSVDIPDEEVIEAIEEYGDPPGWSLCADPIKPGAITLRMPW